MRDVKSQPWITEKYGYGVCDALGGVHCVDFCQCRIDCGAKPIPEKDLEERKTTNEV